ncbi:hypothetical protein [Bacillus solitudinis]|uniref:hypothetical protein n=1 Tax=Bacillus solitudinis TaxID=2014074 RepID=UPI0012FDDF2B|nr:hypothetical protein [Bacillus solitudinis]
MEKYNKELSEALKKFEIVLHNTPDEPNSVYIFNNFIRYFIRVKPGRFTLPASEIMAIIQHEKPLVFSLLRKQDSPYLYYLTNINLDFNEAKEKIETLKQKVETRK